MKQGISAGLGEKKMCRNRMKTREVRIGTVPIGGANPIAIQSMCNTKTSDVEATVSQIRKLTEAGCEIVRVAIPDEEAAFAIPEIRERIRIPLVGDIHFNHRLALQAIENGIDKIRINPGNIGGRDCLKAVVEKAAEREIPIRVGVNSGSLEKEALLRHGGHVTAEGLVESALEKAQMIEEMGYHKLVISIKSSDVLMCVRAHELIRERTDIPLHVGITEAGTVWAGSIKSSVGLGLILYQGIGDTIRVSLTGDPVEEVRTAKQILKTLGLRQGGIEVVSCPTCGRTQIDLIRLADEVGALCANKKYEKLSCRVACMGCVVNGPGEAKEAELGICGGKGEGLILRRGEILRKVPEERLLSEFQKELDAYLSETEGR